MFLLLPGDCNFYQLRCREIIDLAGSVCPFVYGYVCRSLQAQMSSLYQSILGTRLAKYTKTHSPLRLKDCHCHIEVFVCMPVIRRRVWIIMQQCCIPIGHSNPLQAKNGKHSFKGNLLHLIHICSTYVKQ